MQVVALGVECRGCGVSIFAWRAERCQGWPEARKSRLSAAKFGGISAVLALVRDLMVTTEGASGSEKTLAVA